MMLSFPTHIFWGKPRAKGHSDDHRETDIGSGRMRGAGGVLGGHQLAGQASRIGPPFSPRMRDAAQDA
jgi:hypothetical protein